MISDGIFETVTTLPQIWCTNFPLHSFLLNKRSYIITYIFFESVSQNGFIFRYTSCWMNVRFVNGCFFVILGRWSKKNMGIFHHFCHEVSLAMNYLCQLPNYMHEIIKIYTILTTRTMIFELGVHKVTLAFLTSELATEGSIKRALLFFLGITLRKTILVKRLSPKSKLHFWL